MQLDYDPGKKDTTHACDQFGCTETALAKEKDLPPKGWYFVEHMKMRCGTCYTTLLRVQVYRENWAAWESKCQVARMRRA